MTDKALAQADPEWLALISSAREWLSGPHGQLLLEDEQRVLEDELGRFFGGYLVHYGPAADTPPKAPQVQRSRGGDWCGRAPWPAAQAAAKAAQRLASSPACSSREAI